MVFEKEAFDDLGLRIEPFGDEGEDSFIGLHGSCLRSVSCRFRCGIDSLGFRIL